MLSHLEASQLDSFYRQHVTPLKTRLDTRYMCRATFWTDLRLLAATFLVWHSALRAPAAFRNLMAQRMDLEADPSTSVVSQIASYSQIFRSKV